MELLRLFSIASLILAFVSALLIVIDIGRGHRQQMAVMEWVWPITGLWAGPLGLLAYWRIGRVKSNAAPRKKPFWAAVLTGDLHCAAGCTLGDFAAEWLVFFTGIRLAGSALWSDYLFDFALAYAAGIVFQYFAIAPMRQISGWPAIWAAVKADTISLTAFELGMFAWMGISHGLLFKTAHLHPTEPLYWFMMQIAMLVGFLTAYPANWWLIRKGFKEEM